jgi:hypothetical protein
MLSALYTTCSAAKFRRHGGSVYEGIIGHRPSCMTTTSSAAGCQSLITRDLDPLLSLHVCDLQITRVLLERLIVNRPHPWGLLITFIEVGMTRCRGFVVVGRLLGLLLCAAGSYASQTYSCIAHHHSLAMQSACA